MKFFDLILSRRDNLFFHKNKTLEEVLSYLDLYKVQDTFNILLVEHKLFGDKIHEDIGLFFKPTCSMDLEYNSLGLSQLDSCKLFKIEVNNGRLFSYNLIHLKDALKSINIKFTLFECNNGKMEEIKVEKYFCRVESVSWSIR